MFVSQTITQIDEAIQTITQIDEAIHVYVVLIRIKTKLTETERTTATTF